MKKSSKDTREKIDFFTQKFANELKESKTRKIMPPQVKRAEFDVLDIRKFISLLGISLEEKSDLPVGVSGNIIARKPLNDLSDLSFVSISIRTDEKKGRQNFTIAHELGHLVDAYFDGDILQASRSLEQLNPVEEQEADDFAGNLLLPEKEYRKLVTDLGDTINFRNLMIPFELSPTALQYRAYRLKLI